MASRKNSRKNSRRNSRKNSRRNSRKNNRRNSRRNRRNSRRNNVLYGGAYSPMALSLAQGREYNEIHANQRGGGYLPAPLAGAPVGTTGVLDGALRDAARITPLDGKLNEIVGMRDPDQMPPAPAQTGGGRKGRKGSRKGRKGKKGSRKGKKHSRKGSKGSRRRQSGGGHGGWSGAPLSSPNMLLTPAQAAKAGTADFSNPWLRD
jgi:hypothetical protein